MSASTYIQADAVAYKIREEHRDTPGFKSADVNHLRSMGIYRVIVRVVPGTDLGLPTLIDGVDVEVRDGTEEPSPYVT